MFLCLQQGRLRNMNIRFSPFLSPVPGCWFLPSNLCKLLFHKEEYSILSSFVFSAAFFSATNFIFCLLLPQCPNSTAGNRPRLEWVFWLRPFGELGAYSQLVWIAYGVLFSPSSRAETIKLEGLSSEWRWGNTCAYCRAKALSRMRVCDVWGCWEDKDKTLWLSSTGDFHLNGLQSLVPFTGR